MKSPVAQTFPRTVSAARRQRAHKARRWPRFIAAALLVGIILVNSIAFMQARAMTHYAPAGTRTAKPEELSPLDKVAALLFGVAVTRPTNAHTPGDAGMSHNTVPVVADGGTIVAWEIAGKPPTTVGSNAVVALFPGYAESKESLLPASALFNRAGYTTWLVDFRGAGGSTGDDTTLGVREARDVKLVVDRISMGGAAVLRAAAQEGVKPDAMVLESPFDSLLATVGNRFHAMGLPAFPGAELLVAWGSLQQGFNGFEHNPAEYAKQVRCPTLLMYGDADPRVTPEQSQRIYANLGGTKEYVSFPRAGHEALVLSDPERWRESVLRFLERIGQQE